MPKYVVLYRSPVSAAAQMESNDPAMAAEAMKAWNAWSEEAGSSVVELGQPLGNGRTVTSSGSADAGSDVAGFSILQAENIEAVVKILGSHPHLQMPGAGIEIHETLSFPGGM